MPESNPPLLALAERLKEISRPPALIRLIQFVKSDEDFREFVKVVRELLPERENDIFAIPTIHAQIVDFCRYFEERYFPLGEPWYMEDLESYSDFFHTMPLYIQGFQEDYYHYMPEDGRRGYMLMGYLLEPPDPDEADARIALAEACAEHVGRELVQRVPEGGLSREDAHLIFAGTEYEGMVHMADWMNWSTGNFFQDTNEEDYSYNYYGYFDWDLETVQWLTQQWQQSEVINRAMNNLADRIETNPEQEFTRILEFIEARKGGEDGQGTGEKGSADPAGVAVGATGEPGSPEE